jgi:hypothetical protein
MVVALVCLTLSAGCATVTEYGPPVGARGGLDSLDTTRVAVMPFRTEDPFGYSPEELETLVQTYEGTAVAELEALGMKVVTPDAVRKALRDKGREEELDTRLDLGRPLDQLFEQERTAEGVIEDERTAFIREVAELLDVQLVLVGQVLYHGEGECSGSAKSVYTPYVVFEGGPSPGEGLVPCAVSHFHAKLIDAPAGRTVWYNRALRELRASSPNAPTPDLIANAREAVGLVITDSAASLKSELAAR